MNTFSNQPSNLSPITRHLIRQAWKTVAQAKTATASQHAAYCLLLGKDLNKAFTPLKRESRIKGYALGNPYFSRDEAHKIVDEGFLQAFKPWENLLKDHPKTQGWKQAYEGGFAAIQKTIEKNAQASQLDAVMTPNKAVVA